VIASCARSGGWHFGAQRNNQLHSQNKNITSVIYVVSNEILFYYLIACSMLIMSIITLSFEWCNLFLFLFRLMIFDCCLHPLWAHTFKITHRIIDAHKFLWTHLLKWPCGSAPNRYKYIISIHKPITLFNKPTIYDTLCVCSFSLSVWRMRET
jgi:hypothetical protein